MSECVGSRGAMMRFVFPALFAMIIALLFVDFYFLSRPAREFDLTKYSRPNRYKSSRPYRHLRLT